MDRGYLGMASRLNAKGIAALTSDKRGVGDSEGEYTEAPDLNVPATDMLAWVDAAKQRPEIDARQIGVLGWSQGGWIGPLSASRSSDISFVVSISGPGVSPLEQNIYDKTNQFRASGATEDEVARFSAAIRHVWTYLVTGSGLDKAEEAWNSIKDDPNIMDTYNHWPLVDREKSMKGKRLPTFAAHSAYDPAPVLKSLQVPVLAVFGEADTVVPVERSIAAFEGAFDGKRSELLDILTFPGAGHGISMSTPDGFVLADGYPDQVVQWIRETIDSRESGNDP